MSVKERLSVTVDADLIEFGYRVVKVGEAENLSAWVNTVLRAELERDKKLKAMDEFIAAYEAEFGEITEADMRESERRWQAKAIHVRPARPQ